MNEDKNYPDYSKRKCVLNFAVMVSVYPHLRTFLLNTFCKFLLLLHN